jgi:hypothetical protein
VFWTRECCTLSHIFSTPTCALQSSRHSVRGRSIACCNIDWMSVHKFVWHIDTNSECHIALALQYPTASSTSYMVDIYRPCDNYFTCPIYESSSPIFGKCANVANWSFISKITRMAAVGLFCRIWVAMPRIWQFTSCISSIRNFGKARPDKKGG